MFAYSYSSSTYINEDEESTGWKCNMWKECVDEGREDRESEKIGSPDPHWALLQASIVIELECNSGEERENEGGGNRGSDPFTTVDLHQSLSYFPLLQLTPCTAIKCFSLLYTEHNTHTYTSAYPLDWYTLMHMKFGAECSCIKEQ